MAEFFIELIGGILEVVLDLWVENIVSIFVRKRKNKE